MTPPFTYDAKHPEHEYVATWTCCLPHMGLRPLAGRSQRTETGGRNLAMPVGQTPAGLGI
jgi:hypothetical protein